VALKEYCQQQQGGDMLGAEKEKLYVMACGNKNALGKSALEALCLSEDKLQWLRDSNRLLMELWNE